MKSFRVCVLERSRYHYRQTLPELPIKIIILIMAFKGAWGDTRSSVTPSMYCVSWAISRSITIFNNGREISNSGP